MITIRPERPDDREGIHRVVEAAFGRDEEPRLVDALRTGSAFIPGLSLVAVEGADIVGHVLFTRLTVTEDGVVRPALALAPLAVLPARQNLGIGSALVRRGLADARELGHQVVIVFGHPTYYPRFGFVPAQPLGIRPPFAAAADKFLVLGLPPSALSGLQGAVEYPSEFGIETTGERRQRVLREEVAICAYDPGWPESFRREREHLRSCLPSDLVGRIEHFGSTAVPGLAAKPIVDILVEVTSLQGARERIAPLLESQGYDYFWRPTHGDDGPFYAWFIKREPRTGARTHHIHMVESHFAEHWDRLLFRDYLIEHPEAAREYEALKLRLASVSGSDRVAYTRGKTELIVTIIEQAKRDHSRRGRAEG